MALTGNQWLALTPEEALEPEIPICDPHHHFWEHRPEPADYQRYLLPELAADLNTGHSIRSTVFVEARSSYRPDGPEELRSVGEVEFVQSLADAAATGQYGPARPAHGIIGRADLKLGPAVRPVLEALQQASPDRFRGIRHSVGWDPSPELDNREVEGCLLTRRLPRTAPASSPIWATSSKTPYTSRNSPTWRISPTPSPNSPSC